MIQIICVILSLEIFFLVLPSNIKFDNHQSYLNFFFVYYMYLVYSATNEYNRALQISGVCIFFCTFAQFVSYYVKAHILYTSPPHVLPTYYFFVYLEKGKISIAQDAVPWEKCMKYMYLYSVGWICILLTMYRSIVHRIHVLYVHFCKDYVECGNEKHNL